MDYSLHIFLFHFPTLEPIPAPFFGASALQPMPHSAPTGWVQKRELLGRNLYSDIPWTNPLSNTDSLHCCSAAPTAAQWWRRLESHWCEPSLPLQPCAFLQPANGITRKCEHCSWSMLVLWWAEARLEWISAETWCSSSSSGYKATPGLKS